MLDCYSHNSVRLGLLYNQFKTNKHLCFISLGLRLGSKHLPRPWLLRIFQNKKTVIVFIHYRASLFTKFDKCIFSLWVKFSKEPSVFVTVAHHHAGLKRDAASIWLEDISQSSFKICLRELQNYAGSHEDVYVVCSALLFFFFFFF